VTIRAILQYPDPCLRECAEPVGAFTDAIGELCRDLVQTLRYGTDGRAVGLAATQVGVPLRIFVMEATTKGGKRQSYVCINPRLQSESGEAVNAEGCLSFPDVTVRVRRATRIRLAYEQPSGRHTTRMFEGVLAICAQHELDHLDGKLMVDHGDPDVELSA